MRHSAALPLLALIALSGCLGRRMDAALAPLDGRPASEAFAAFGPPDASEAENGNKVYTWIVDEFGPMGFPSDLAVQYKCRLRIVADSRDIVRSTDWRGNAYGCDALLTRWGREPR